jgi:hypothetical protein
MSMAARKKLKTIDNIVSHYQSHHSVTGKSFDERIKRFEELFDEGNIHRQQMKMHAHYVAWGNPEDRENFPGAYEKAHQKLAGYVQNDDDKLDDESKLTEILEAYVDEFLQKAMGNKFSDTLAHAEAEGLDKEAIRKIKGQLFGKYTADEEGKYMNILDDKFIKGLKGKKKIDIVEQLQGISDRTKKTYALNLTKKAIEGLITEDDHLDLAKYVKPKFDKAGFVHDNHPLTMPMENVMLEYQFLLQGESKELKGRGYKYMPAEK